MRLEKHKAPDSGGSGASSLAFCYLSKRSVSFGGYKKTRLSSHSDASNTRQNLLHCSGSCELGPQMSLSEVPFMTVNCSHHLACDSHCEGQGEMHT